MHAVGLLHALLISREGKKLALRMNKEFDQRSVSINTTIMRKPNLKNYLPGGNTNVRPMAKAIASTVSILILFVPINASLK